MDNAVQAEVATPSADSLPLPSACVPNGDSDVWRPENDAALTELDWEDLVREGVYHVGQFLTTSVTFLCN